MRKNMTPAERKLWGFLRTFPLKMWRQKPISHFIVDFYCPKLKLVIEIDGDSHFTEEGKAYDQERTQILEGYDLKVVRFTNDQVLHEFEVVCEEIMGFIPL
jgi:very-short-patch-repair endonuclease